MDAAKEPVVRKYISLEEKEKKKAQKQILTFYYDEDFSLGSTARKMLSKGIKMSASLVGEEIKRLGYELRSANDYLNNKPDILENYGKNIKKLIWKMRRKPEPATYYDIAKTITDNIQPISLKTVRKIYMKMERGNHPYKQPISSPAPS